MPYINELIEQHLIPEDYCERQMFSGDRPRQFFIEIFNPGCTPIPLPELIEMYDPAPHNADWQAEYSKWQAKKNPDPDKIMTPRRAIAFMFAGKMGVHKRYKETELRSHVYGRAKINRNLHFLNITDQYFAWPDIPKKTYKPGA